MAVHQQATGRGLLRQWQQHYGNGYVRQVVQQARGATAGSPSRNPIQARLALGPVDDPYEREADHVARHVVRQLHTRQEADPTGLQAAPAALQRRPALQPGSAPPSGEVSPAMEAHIREAHNTGQPLPETTREPMERAFGADFGSVRIHTDDRADQLNQSVQARAFTTGQDIFFRRGEYSPQSRSGQELLAHELTHVVQQNEAGAQGHRTATIQRAWIPAQGFGNSEKWDTLVQGLRWHRDFDGTYFFFIEDEAAVPPALLDGFQDLEGLTQNEAAWSKEIIQPPKEQPPSRWQEDLPEPVLKQILSQLSPQDLGAALQAAKGWRRTPEFQDEMMRAAFERLALTDPSGEKQKTLIRNAQSLTPYRSLPQMSIATRMAVHPGPALPLAWREYQKTSDPQNKHLGAVLYTIRNVPEMNYWQEVNNRMPWERHTVGSVYFPRHENPETGEMDLHHNMAVNRMWLLGLMHGGRDMTLVTPPTNETLTRGYSGHPEKEGQQGVSALGRELLAITGSHAGADTMFYQPQTPKRRALELPGPDTAPEMVTQDFIRNPEASQATIDDISYREDMSSQTAREILQGRQVPGQDVAGPSLQNYQDATVILALKRKAEEYAQTEGRRLSRERLAANLQYFAEAQWLLRAVFDQWKLLFPNDPQRVDEEVLAAMKRFEGFFAPERIHKWLAEGFRP